MFLRRMLVWILVILSASVIIVQIVSRHEIKFMHTFGYRAGVIERVCPRVFKAVLDGHGDRVPRCPDWVSAASITGVVNDGEVDLCRLSTGTLVMLYSPGTADTIALRRTLRWLSSRSELQRICYDPTNGTHSAGNVIRLLDIQSGNAETIDQ